MVEWIDGFGRREERAAGRCGWMDGSMEFGGDWPALKTRETRWLRDGSRESGGGEED